MVTRTQRNYCTFASRCVMCAVRSSLLVASWRHTMRRTLLRVARHVAFRGWSRIEPWSRNESPLDAHVLSSMPDRMDGKIWCLGLDCSGPTLRWLMLACMWRNLVASDDTRSRNAVSIRRQRKGALGTVAVVREMGDRRAGTTHRAPLR